MTAAIGMGCARIGEATGGVPWHRAVRMVRTAASGGIRFFDTADAYNDGTSERILGRALAGRQVTIATKAGYLFRPRSEAEARLRSLVGPIVRRVSSSGATSLTQQGTGFHDQDFSVPYLRQAVEGSLQRLRRSHLDLFQLHAPRGADADAVCELAGELLAGRRIRSFGIGIEHVEEAEPWIDRDVVTSIQLPYSIVDPRTSDPLIDRARAAGKQVIVRSVLARGGLLSSGPDESLRDRAGALAELSKRAGRSVEQLAIAFAQARDGVNVVLVGVRTPAQLDALLAVVRAGPVPDDVLTEIDAIARR